MKVFILIGQGGDKIKGEFCHYVASLSPKGIVDNTIYHFNGESVLADNVISLAILSKIMSTPFYIFVQNCLDVLEFEVLLNSVDEDDGVDIVVVTHDKLKCNKTDREIIYTAETYGVLCVNVDNYVSLIDDYKLISM